MTTSVMCACAKYQSRGCFECSTREARLINAYRLGFDDHGIERAYLPRPVGPGPVASWPEDERAWYEAGSAAATGKYREVRAS